MKISRSFTQRSNGEPFTVEIDIDVEKLAQELARRAITSKLGKSKLLDGKIKCRVVTRGGIVPPSTT